MMEGLAKIFSFVLGKSASIVLVVACILLVRWMVQRYPKKYSYALWAGLAVNLLRRSEGALRSARIFKDAAIPGMTWKGMESLSKNVSKAAADVSAAQPAIWDESVKTAQTAVTEAERFLGIAVWIWLAGVLVFFLYFVVSYMHIKYKVRFAVLLKENIYECGEISSPFVMGILKPRIYLPHPMDKEEQEYVICHEKCHIRRRDYLVKLLAFGLLGIYWFHPFMWLAYMFMCRDMEMSCDELAVERLGMDTKQAYSTTLLNFASQRRMPGNLLGFGESYAGERIKNVLKFCMVGRKTNLALTALALFLMISLGCSEIAVGKSRENATEEALAAEAGDTAKALFEAATPYVGDAPAVGNLLTVMQENGLFPEEEYSIELGTDVKPYSLTIHFANQPEDEEELCREMYQTGILSLALVENLNEVMWTFPLTEKGEEVMFTYYLDEAALESAYGMEMEEIKECGASAQKLQELLDKAGMEPDVELPELKNQEIAIIGGADGPTSVFLAGKLGGEAKE